MIDNRLVSVIVVVKDGATVLPDLFRTVATQTYSEIEVIVNDDLRTTDNTRQLVEDWSRKIPLTYLNKNNNPSQGRLEGSKVARGAYLLHLDADMQLAPHLIEDCVKKIQAGSDGLIIPEEVIGQGYWTKCKWLEKRCYIGDESVESPRFFKTDAYFDVGGHDPDLTFSEDKELDLRFREHRKIVGRSTEFILHNERRITFVKSVAKKFYWAKSSLRYLKMRPKSAMQQGNTIFRPAFFRNWRLLLSHPLLTVGMFSLKVGETVGAVGGLLYSEVLKKEISYKHH